MSFSVREAHPGDAGQLITYLRRLVDEPGIYIALSPGEFNYSLEDERQLLEDVAASDNSVILVAEVDGQIIGLLAPNFFGRDPSHHWSPWEREDFYH